MSHPDSCEAGGPWLLLLLPCLQSTALHHYTHQNKFRDAAINKAPSVRCGGCCCCCCQCIATSSSKSDGYWWAIAPERSIELMLPFCTQEPPGPFLGRKKQSATASAMASPFQDPSNDTKQRHREAKVCLWYEFCGGFGRIDGSGEEQCNHIVDRMALPGTRNRFLFICTHREGRTGRVSRGIQSGGLSTCC